MIEVVKAQESHDTAKIAKLMWSEDAALMAYIFGSLEVLQKILPIEWARKDTSNSFANSWLAMDAGSIVGFMSGYKASDADALLNASDKIYGAAMGEKTWGERMALIEGLFPQPDGAAFYMYDLSITPQMQGHGVGRQLIETAMEHARITGCKSLCLDVDATSPAVEFYKAMGLQIVKKSTVPPSLNTHRIPMHYHMSVTLTPNDKASLSPTEESN